MGGIQASFCKELLMFIRPAMLKILIKISSSDITNKPFIEHISSFNKPIILSTGASNLEEIKDALSWIKPFSVPVALLHCVLNYPTLRKNANLNIIRSLKKNFQNNVVGYSDHTLPDKTMSVLKLAFLYGAEIIEKHFTLDKSLPGNDHYHAMDKYDLIRFRKKIDRYLFLLGNNKKKVIKAEQKSRLHARRSIYAKINLKKGEILTKDKMICKRPGNGLSPTYWDRLLNKQLMNDIKEDNQIKLEEYYKGLYHLVA